MAEQHEPKKRTGAVKKVKEEDKTPNENQLVVYFRETRGEMRKVTWPTRDETTRLTIIVLAVTAAFAVFLGTIDLGWSTVLEWMIKLIVGA